MSPFFYFAVSIIVILFGSQSVVQKWLIKELPYTMVIFLSSLLYCLAVFTYGFIHKDVIVNNISKLRKEHVLGLIFTGIIAGFVANLLFYKLLSTTNTAVLTTFTKLSPIVTALIAFYWLKEPLTPQMLIGIVVVMFGLVLITTGQPNNK